MFFFNLCCTVPKSVLNINIEQCPDARNFTLDGNNERWWDQTDLTKLIMANNCMKTLPDDIRLLHALQVLDVRFFLYFLAIFLKYFWMN